MSNTVRKPRSKGTRRSYDPDVLAEAVDRVLIKDQPLRRTCRELNIEKMFLHRYIRKYIDSKPEDERWFFNKLLEKRRKVRMGFDPNDTSASGSTTEDEGIPISQLVQAGHMHNRQTPPQPVFIPQTKTIRHFSLPVQGHPQDLVPSGTIIDLTDDNIPEPNSFHPNASSIYVNEGKSVGTEEPRHTIEVDPLFVYTNNEEADHLVDMAPLIENIDIIYHELPKKKEPEYSVDPLMTDNINHLSLKISKKETDLPSITSNIGLYPHSKKDPGCTINMNPLIYKLPKEREVSGDLLNVVHCSDGGGESLLQGQDDLGHSLGTFTPPLDSVSLSEDRVLNEQESSQSLITYPPSVSCNDLPSFKSAESKVFSNSVNECLLTVNSDKLSYVKFTGQERHVSSMSRSNIGIDVEDLSFKEAREPKGTVLLVEAVSLNCDNATSDKFTKNNQSSKDYFLPNDNDNSQCEDLTKQKASDSEVATSPAANKGCTYYKSTAQGGPGHSASPSVLAVDCEASSDKRRRRGRRKPRCVSKSSPLNDKTPNDAAVEQERPCCSTNKSTIDIDDLSANKRSDLEGPSHSKNLPSLHLKDSVETFKPVKVEPLPRVVEAQLAAYIKAIDEMGLKQFFGMSSVLKTVELFVNGHKLNPPFKDYESGTKWFKNFCRRYNINYNKFKN